MRYVKTTSHLPLTLQPDARINVTSYIDASYGVHPNGRSHTGSIVTLGKGAVHAKSTKQKLVSKSSTEAELVALSDEASACHMPTEKSRFSDSPRMYQMNRACGCFFAVWVA
jgi:hypothetical protein